MKDSILDYLQQSVRQHPDKCAAVDEFGSCTWAELDQLSRRCGTALARRSPIRRPIPVLMDKGIDTLGVFLGAVYAGCFYVQLNPELTPARLRQIVEVLSPDLLVTDEAHLDMARELFDAEKIVLQPTLAETEVDDDLLTARRAAHIDTDPLYANFTSGSTGVPKGVLVGHRSVLDFIDCFVDTFGINETDIIANQAPFDFDVSVKDIYPALKTGATLVIVPRRLFSRPVELLDFLCEHRVTNLTWAVSALCLVSTFHGLDYKTPDTVKRVMFSGEVMPQKHLNSWMSHLPEATFVNLYGPTEITCNCTYHIIDRQRDYSEGIPIGLPFPNERVFLLDGEDHLVETPEVTGEVCVAGSALALGYYCAPEQTAKAFVQNPLNRCYPELIYRTGDLARYNEQGELVFSGRKDFQIKYMGHRIELEEIERAMSAVAGVERVCCVFDEKRSRLTGYYVGTLDKKELHGILSQTLPEFMIPAPLVQVDEMPLTKNGKIDRKALAERKRGARRER